MLSSPFIQAAVLAAAVCCGLSACKIEKRAAKPAEQADASKYANQDFDPKAQVGDIWDSKVLPALQARAADYPALQQAMQADLDGAGAKFGNRKPVEGSPWNFAVRVKGRILAVNTETAASTMDVDVDGDGKADVTVQLGPVIRGAALRDALPFISFTDYANQVEFAQLASAFNEQAYLKTTKALTPDALVNQQVDLLGVFTDDENADMPLVTPVQLSLAAKP